MIATSPDLITWTRRPELLDEAALSDEDVRVLEEIKTESDTEDGGP